HRKFANSSSGHVDSSASRVAGTTPGTSRSPAGPASKSSIDSSARSARGTTSHSATSRTSPMLDSRGFGPAPLIAVRRTPPNVEDLRPTTVVDDPVQRRDLILVERARGGDLDAFNDLVECYQDLLFSL